MTEQVRVAVGVLILKNNKVLFGKRKGAHGEGTWAPPGGHLEFGETIEECAKREVLEETGVKIKNLRIAALTNDIYDDDKEKHYITIHVTCEIEEGEPKNMEPEKCEEWVWFQWEELSENLFLPIKNLLKQNFNPFK